MHSFACLALTYLVSAGDTAPIQYPETKRVDHVDTYHGTEVADPYRWLEADVRESEEVADWVARQNAVTFAYLEQLPDRDRIKARLTELWDYERYSTPTKAGDRYFYFKNDGLQNQSVLYVANAPDAEGDVLIDPNTWSEDGTIALSGTWLTDNGRYVAYAVSDSGSDWRTIHVMDVANKIVLDDKIEWVKYGGVAWRKDNSGFFYTGFDEPEDASEQFQGLTYNQKIHFHRLGTSQNEDVLVYRRPDQPKWGYGLDVTQDGRYLVITVWVGTDERYRVHYKDLSEPESPIVELVDNFEHEYTFIGNDGPVFYFKTSLDAPNGRMIAVDLEYPDPNNWQELVAEQENALSAISYIGNRFVARYLEDAKTKVVVYSTQGREDREVALPGIGSAYGFGGRQDEPETFYSFSSYATPPSIYKYNIRTGESRLLRRANVDIDTDAFEVEQVFYESKDGTRVPMFLTYKNGLTRGGNNRVLLYGYGGFNASLTPSFSAGRLAWVEQGGVLAVANLRGGGEYGEAWHKAGTKLNKQNVFDDFIAAAEWLIENKYTRPELLGIQGGSNGGLLVGAVMTQRPELFGAALPAVGVMDMLRYHKFTAGRFWVDDYGSSDDPEEFQALYAYSPYHNLKPGVAYPPTLVTTADTDDRVVPGHSFKFAARLQHVQAGDAPVLIRIETRAGHGGGKPTSKQIEELADEYAFLLANLNVDE